MDFLAFSTIKPKNNSQVAKDKAFLARYYYLLDNGAKKLPKQGTARIVFRLGDKVVKLARTDTMGLEQNKAEIAIGASDNGFTTKVYENDKDGNWLVADYAEPISETELTAMLNDLLHLPKQFDLHEIIEMFRYGSNKLTGNDDEYFGEEIPVYHERLFEYNDWYTRFLKFLVRYNIDASDLKADNWGLLNGAPVIVDYGLLGV